SGVSWLVPAGAGTSGRARATAGLTALDLVVLLARRFQVFQRVGFRLEVPLRPGLEVRICGLGHLVGRLLQLWVAGARRLLGRRLLRLIRFVRRLRFRLGVVFLSARSRRVLARARKRLVQRLGEGLAESDAVTERDQHAGQLRITPLGALADVHRLDVQESACDRQRQLVAVDDLDVLVAEERSLLGVVTVVLERVLHLRRPTALR